MPSLRKFKSAVVMLCAIVVALQLVGAHAHLCFDGREPPVSLHFSDAVGAHHLDDAPNGLDAAHDDTDVSVAGNPLLKRIDVSLDAVVLFAALAFVLAFIPISRHVPFRRDDPPSAFGTLHPHFRPPLRAPPRITSLFV